jgi:hypothetical protein
MEFGVHLPLMDFGEEQFSLEELLAYADAAPEHGFGTPLRQRSPGVQPSLLGLPTALAIVQRCLGLLGPTESVQFPRFRSFDDPLRALLSLGSIGAFAMLEAPDEYDRHPGLQ